MAPTKVGPLRLVSHITIGWKPLRTTATTYQLSPRLRVWYIHLLSPAAATFLLPLLLMRERCAFGQPISVEGRCNVMF